MRKCCKFVIVPHLNTKEKTKINSITIRYLYRFENSYAKIKREEKLLLCAPTFRMTCCKRLLLRVKIEILATTIKIDQFCVGHWPQLIWIWSYSGAEFCLVNENKMYFLCSFVFLLALSSELCKYVQSCSQLATIEVDSCRKPSNFYGKGLFMLNK